MAEELGKFLPLVGGPAHGHVLLMPLEALSMVEETVVRDKAVESINIVAAELPESSAAEHLIPLVQVPLAKILRQINAPQPGHSHMWRGGSSMQLTICGPD